MKVIVMKLVNWLLRRSVTAISEWDAPPTEEQTEYDVEWRRRTALDFASRGTNSTSTQLLKDARAIEKYISEG